jgi:predicted RNase H-like HicB family nuclease
MAKAGLQYAIWKEGKHYVSQCLNVDVSSFGKTQKEALKNLEEALELYFEDVKRSDYFGKGKGIFGDAMKYQKKLRNEWQ